MSATEQINNIQAKVQEKLAQVQKHAQVRAKELESEAKKAFELFGDRAQAELKQFLSHAQGSTRDQWSKFGAELVKLGNKVQEMAKETEAAVESATEKVAEKVSEEAQKMKDAVDVH
jgi:hypothetical protein